MNYDLTRYSTTLGPANNNHHPAARIIVAQVWKSPSGREEDEMSKDRHVGGERKHREKSEVFG